VQYGVPLFPYAIFSGFRSVYFIGLYLFFIVLTATGGKDLNMKEKQYFIPMEVTVETIKDYGIKPEDVVWTKIGNRRVRAFMVPVNKEQYYEFMRPLWREDKREQRQERPVSLDELYENTEYEKASDYNLEAEEMKKALLVELHKALDELEKIDRLIVDTYSNNKSEAEIGRAIGMSQKGVNKRKHKIFEKLKKYLCNFGS
jgi:RNA polymerase sigma factor (sigma-70 family)